MSDNNTETDDNEEIIRRISDTANPIKLSTKVVRGTEPRNKDVIKVKVDGDDPEETVHELNETIAELRSTADTVRNIQPEVDDEKDE